MPKCQVPNCTETPVSRGLCKQHYQTAFKLVKSGKTSWRQLEKTGKVAPNTVSRTRGRPLSLAAHWFLTK